MAPFYEWGSTVSRVPSHYKETVYFLPVSLWEFLVFIRLTLEGWRAESTLEQPSGFEPRTPGLGIQRLNHQAGSNSLGNSLKMSTLFDKNVKKSW